MTAKFKALTQWKTELKELGFVYKGGMFMLEPGESAALQFGVSIQKNVHSATFKINPTILLKNPLLDGVDPEVLVMANLRANGIHLHIDRSSWWPEDALGGDALTALKTHAGPWFEKVGRAGYLSEVLETAIREKESIAQIIEPMDEAGSALPWAPPSSTARKVGSATYYQSAVLHFLNGNRALAIQRTQDWLNALAPADEAARKKAMTQLQRLSRPN